MKINYEFVKREIAGEYFLIPIGEAAKVFDGIIAINELGAFIFDCLPECADAQAVTDRILERYETDRATALADVLAFFDALREAGIIVE
ncbi:MAG: PqqD family protein [Clostridia bacterium]|nr:PqqD family protein [Clostridia bacterium]